MKKHSDNLLKVVAILCITLLEGLALIYRGIDSVILLSVIAVIAGIAGYSVAKTIYYTKNRYRH